MIEAQVNYCFSDDRFNLNYLRGGTCATLKIKGIDGNLVSIMLDEQELQGLELAIREVLKMFPKDP